MAKVQNLERLLRRINALPKQLRKQVGQAIEWEANSLAEMQRRLVPVDTGELKSTIKVRDGDHELHKQVVAGGKKTRRFFRADSFASYDYALGVEFGTQAMPAQPFFYPPYRSAKKRIKARIRRATNRAVKDIANG